MSDDRRDRVRELCDDPDLRLADGLDEALLGIATRCGQPPLACYDAEKCVEVLMSRYGMTYEQAVEDFEFNTAGAWVGERTPIFLRRIEE